MFERRQSGGIVHRGDWWGRVGSSKGWDDLFGCDLGVDFLWLVREDFGEVLQIYESGSWWIHWGMQHIGFVFDRRGSWIGRFRRDGVVSRRPVMMGDGKRVSVEVELSDGRVVGVDSVRAVDVEQSRRERFLVDVRESGFQRAYADFMQGALFSSGLLQESLISDGLREGASDSEKNRAWSAAKDLMDRVGGKAVQRTITSSDDRGSIGDIAAMDVVDVEVIDDV